ncbi:uncharacterized protein LOC143920563 isoform X2 [Arctopsyche grandis]
MCSPFVYNGKILMFGGKTNTDEYSNEVVLFDLTKRTCSNLAPMGQKRNYVQIAEIDGYIYVTGGRGEGFEILDTVERYDPKTDSWTFMAPMLEKRYKHAINVLDGKIYVTGGINKFMNYRSNSSEIYDPKTNSWTYGKPMPFKGLEMNIKTNKLATMKNGKKSLESSISFLVKKSLVNLVPPEKDHLITDYPVTIVAVGSPHKDSNNCVVQFYHPLHDTWTTLAEIDINVSSGYSTIVSHGKLYIFGGKPNTKGPIDEVKSFDLATKEIKKLTPMGQKKSNMGVAEIGEYIYITGGVDENYNTIATVERYDPKTDSWSGMAPMLGIRSAHASDVYEGKMYVTGGTQEDLELLKSLEIYDPNLNKWTLGTPMNHGRMDFAIVFVDGSLFAIGGLDADFGHEMHERLDLNTKQWKDFRNPVEYTWWSAAVLDGLIYIKGYYMNYKYSTTTNEVVELNPNFKPCTKFLLWSTS